MEGERGGGSKLIGATNVRLIANKIAGEPTPATYDFKAAAIPQALLAAQPGAVNVASLGKIILAGARPKTLSRRGSRRWKRRTNKIKPGGGGRRPGALAPALSVGRGENHATGREGSPMSALPSPEYSRNMRLIGHSDQGGRPDGVQLMVHRGFAYIGHMVSQGFSVVDVRDPTRPTTVNYIAAPPGTERASPGA